MAESTPIRVLFVDDDPMMLRMYRRVAGDATTQVMTAGSASEAMTIARQGVDVVVTDLHMPGGDGVSLMRQIRSLDADLPVLLLTGKPDLESAEAAVELGATRYLRKPVETPVLRAAIAVASRAYRSVTAERSSAIKTGMSVLLRGRQSLEETFDRALAAVFLVFQPIIEHETGARFAFEALMRGREPGFTGPAPLLDVAERLGRVQELGRRVRGEAAGALAAIDPGVLLFVNLHPDELNDDELYDPAAPLSAHAGRVVLEITERAALDSIADMDARLAKLRALGYRIAVDDLGAGYAALAGLAELKPEIVKLDMSLVRGIDADPSRTRIVGAIASLCRQLGARVVAEGIETAAERAAVAVLGCELLQGYHFAKPGPLPERG